MVEVLFQQFYTVSISCFLITGFAYINRHYIVPGIRDFEPYRNEINDNVLEVLIGYSPSKVWLNLEKHIHVLIAGSTGSGKSTLLRNILLQFCNKDSSKLSLYLVDFQRVESAIFKDFKIVKNYSYDLRTFKNLLDYLSRESAKRLEMLERLKLTSVHRFNKLYPDKALKYKVIVIDEIVSISRNKAIMNILMQRLAQDRKVGFHYILATQRPSVDVISGSLKVNIPTRISLKMTNHHDSMTVLDEPGAELLSCIGRAIFKFSEKIELQVPFIDENEVISRII